MSKTQDRGSRSEDCRAKAERRDGFNSLLDPQSSKGFTLFELVVVVIIIAILAALFMHRILFYQELAEKTAMEQMAGTVQSALTMQHGRILTRGKASDLPAMAIDNPMHWLQRMPRNYAGEFYDATPLSVEPGNWLFDLKSRELVYVLQHTEHFKPGKDGRQWIRFHVVQQYEKPQAVSLQSAPVELTGLLFEPVEPYVWE